ncbi:MAG: hypothetical protein WA734_04870, partial [Candidatus Acidiferrales bacterium]
TLLAFCFMALTLAPLSAEPVQSSPSAVTRNPTAVSLLQQSISAMGSPLPSDSVANGTAVLTAGSLTESGTVRILTLGTSQTLEQLVTPHVNRSVIFSNFQANVVTAGSVMTLPLEVVSTSQSVSFPLPFIAGVLSNSDIAIQYIGLETLNGSSVQHVQIQDTFASQPNLQGLSALTLRDIWLDATSSLPVRIAWSSQVTEGPNVGISAATTFSNYQSFGTARYPTSLIEYVGGEPLITVTIQSVAFSTGLTGSSFPIQ